MLVFGTSCWQRPSLAQFALLNKLSAVLTFFDQGCVFYYISLSIMYVPLLPSTENRKASCSRNFDTVPTKNCPCSCIYVPIPRSPQLNSLKHCLCIRAISAQYSPNCHYYTTRTLHQQLYQNLAYFPQLTICYAKLTKEKMNILGCQQLAKSPLTKDNILFLAKKNGMNKLMRHNYQNDNLKENE